MLTPTSQESDHLLGALLGPTHAPALRFLKPYFLESFGSFRRLDYGTGHETAFALFLCALTLLRVVHPNPPDERALVLRVFVRYLRLCWRLQDTYKLEPAGSHGVWGIDDYSFLPYILGSGQLRGTPLPSYRAHQLQVTIFLFARSDDNTRQRRPWRQARQRRASHG